MLKRIGVAAAVIALLALGAGVLAGLGTPTSAGHANTLATTTSLASTTAHTLKAAPTGTATPAKRPAARPTVRAHAAVAPTRAIVTPAGQAAGDTVHTPAIGHSQPITVTTSTIIGHTQLITATATPAATPTVVVVDPASITLPAPGPLLLLNPNAASPGGAIDVIGSGFDPAQLITLTIRLGKGTTPILLDTAQASRSGDFSKNVTLPTTLASHTFTVVAQERKGSAHAEAPGMLAIGSPRAALSTAVGKPGDTVYASARGFDPHETVDVFLNNLGTAPVTTIQADANGSISLAPVPVPYGPSGPTSLLLLGRESRGLAAVPFEMLDLYPTASVSSYSAVADTVLTFSASGFGPDEYVDVHLNTPDSPIVGRMRTDSAGSLRNGGDFRIPFSLKQRNIFVLTGEQSHTSSTIAFTVQPYTPVAEPSTYDGSPGTAFTFYGSGFARNETVRVLLDGQQVAVMSTDSLGNLIAKPGLYLIGPRARPGKLRFTLTGDKSVTPAPVAVNVAPAVGPVQLGVANPIGGQ